MKKILILLLVIICCGCSAKYEIKFNGETISDSLTVVYPRENNTDSDINELFTDSFNSIGLDEYYKFSNLSNSNNVIANFSYNYDVLDFRNANVPNDCFTNFDFYEEDNKYYMSAAGYFRCGYYAYEYLDSLDIVISTNHEVIDHNADDIISGKYVWHVNPNSEDFVLKFVTSKSSKSGSGYTLIILSLALVLFVGIFIYKRKKNNEVYI